MTRKLGLRCLLTRREAGNVFAMMALLGASIIAVIVIGCLVGMMFLSHNRGQSRSDEIAVTMAGILNANDRQGQMNNLVERSRELVYASRQSYDSVTNRYQHLEQLSRQLLDKARDGARLVEQNRLALASETQTELINTQTASGSQHGAFNLAFLRTSAPVFSSLESGSIDGVTSNVLSPEALTDLKSYDSKQGYLTPVASASTHFLYSGNINAKLPAPDNDLEFKLSSLPAPVKGTVSPARLTSTSVFKTDRVLAQDGNFQKGGLDQLPSAVQLTLLSPVAARLRVDMESNVKMVSVGAATGGSVPPDQL